MVESARNEFIELMAHNFKQNGFDDCTSKIVGALYIEPKEISLETVSDKTGYSLSAVSTAMKLLVSMGMIKRIKKPHSRKVYFFMEKDMVACMLDHMKKNYELSLLMSKEALPKIIDKYKMKRQESSDEELKIIEQYYDQIVAFEDIMKNFIEALENLQNKSGK
ncbi:MAG: hypothetical protein KAJ20_03300 [Candidatus Aenigmarchaeota archaeon]|nr:hypothetical protein [Candidatus Aenigmarchaeota archaeon]MCK5063333.1 hypothetical protein [Candidatus Aenigmarchaeota archaeon]MCK5290016.1 hypothetical protein [Candidatus Aenigmarchaeota archaeon]MCK5373338.1 hypothetical protein [Candidatus Aenigmarchaeota archaeon]MCK5452411.1 hypothetical protein [Candidatus Aenigmarchaeota archaeon]